MGDVVAKTWAELAERHLHRKESVSCGRPQRNPSIHQAADSQVRVCTSHSAGPPGEGRCGREGTASVKTVLVFFLNEDVQLEMSRIYL